MYQRVTKHDFIEAFRTMGRLNTPASEGGNFTYEALVALFDWLEEYDDQLDDAQQDRPGMQLDVIALCCEFAEYDSAKTAFLEHGSEADYAAFDADDAEQRAEMALDWFRDQTTVIEIPGTDRIIIQQF